MSLLLLAFASPAFGQGTSFTYQGRLTDGGTPVNGNYDFIFQLYDAADGDNLLGHEVGVPSVPVTDGIFSVTLDFGANAFPGADRFLQIIVRRTGDPGIPTLLSPRQKLTSTPYAIRSLSAATADVANNATQLGGTAASQFVLTGDARLSDSRPPTAGSSNYIQNGTAPQSSDFNITGTGRANNFDANQYSLGGARILSNTGTSNLFAGQGAGQANNSGNRNAFFGYNAGLANTIGEFNSFFGNSAGLNNKDGRSNDFFGDSAGSFNSNGSNNSIFGSQAGAQNTTGSFNTFVGNYAGQTNTTGNNNTALGYLSNVLSTNLTNATAIGANARVDKSNSLILGSINGVNFATADTNVGIGTTTPAKRLHVIGDGVFEGNLDVTGTINGNFSGTIQTANNALSLGGIAASQYVQTGDARLADARPPTAGSANYIQNGTAPQPATNFNVSGTGQADSFDAATQFKLGGARVLSNAGTRNLFAGAGAGQANTTGAANAFFGNNAGPVNDAGTSNSFFGSNAGFVNTSGNFNAFFGSGSGGANVDGNNNAFFGFTSGRSNASGFNNSFFGNAAGFGNTNGGNNTYFGFFAGKNNTLGQQNTFVGASTGATNVTGGNNTLLGYGADVGAPDNSNATAIGAQAFVAQADSLVLGAINGVNGATFDTKVGIGTPAPAARLHVVGDGLFTGNLTVNGNLNGNFSLATVNAATQYNLGGLRIVAGDTTSNNFFAGFGTGGSITTGTRNAFFGSLAGVLTTSGNQNAFFGYQAGNQNSTGAANSFFGAQAGQKNTSGNGNSFFGGNAGLNNATGGDNSYFGVNAGNANTAGSFNSMFGESAGQNNTTVFNSFFGYQAGQMTSTGDTNAFFGFQAGQQNTAGARNAFFGAGSGSFTTGSRNAFVGTSAGGHNLTGSGNIAIGDTADFGSGGLTNATAIGNRALVSASDSLVLGGILGVNGCTAANNCNDTKVGIGTPAPSAKLHVVGDGLFTGNLTVNGTLNANVNFGPGNANYIQNTTTQQTTSNFNISGDGTAGGTLSGNVINAATQFNIGGSRVFTNDQNANVFAGFDAGSFNSTGSQNTFVGLQTGTLNDAGSRNTFLGFQAGQVNTSGTSNTAIGRRADFGANNLDHATAIGAESIVSSNNTIVLGRSAGQDTVQVPGNLNIIGTISGNLPSNSNSYIQNTRTPQAADFNIGGDGTVGGDLSAGRMIPNTLIAGGFSNPPLVVTGGTNPTVLVGGFPPFLVGQNAGVGFVEGGRFAVLENGNVGIGNPNPADKLNVNGNVSLLLGSAGSTQVCQNASLQLATCSSSLRYKINIAPFSSGLNFIRRLRPISFDWKQGGVHDVGFGAEDVARINPLFVTYNKDGQVEGVKYDRFSTVFVNAFNEQQSQIEQQQEQIKKQQEAIKQQQGQIDALKKLVCSDHPEASVCKK